MAEIPDRIRDLLRRRQDAREAKDFALADSIRDQILAAGFALRDTPAGVVAEPAARFVSQDPAAIPSILSEHPACDVSLHLLHEGFRDDVERFLAGLEAHNDLSEVEVVIVDNASPDGAWFEDLAAAHLVVRIVHLDRECGWATAHNAGLRTSRGRIIALVDLSIEPVGDILTPLHSVFSDASVGLAGPFGLVSQTMREWHPSDGPEVDAIEGYFLATRREALATELLCEKFKWYRNADIDLSFQIRSGGLRAVVVPLPVVKHVHRGWDALGEEERAKRSRRNHYLFFDRWKHAQALLGSHLPQR